MRRFFSMTAAAVFLLGGSATVLAFPNGQFWHMPASGDAGVNRAGSGGIYYTGGVKDFGLKCSSCHIDGDGTIGATIVPTPAWQTVGGANAYSPGQSYSLTLTLTGEHKGLGQGLNNGNGFSLTVEDASGATKGIFTSDSGQTSSSCPPVYPATPVGTSVVYGDCHGIMFLDSPNNVTWTFTWVAPAAGAGDLTVFYGVVDGNSRGDSALDDDVKEGTIVLREGT